MRRRPNTSDLYDDYPVIAAQTVHEAERDTFTGLYDANGTPLHRQPQAVGFDLSRVQRTPKKRST